MITFDKLFLVLMWNYSVQWSYDSNSPATEVTDVQYKPSTDSHFVEQVDLVNGQLNTFIFNNPLLRKYQYCVLTANSLVVEKKTYLVLRSFRRCRRRTCYMTNLCCPRYKVSILYYGTPTGSHCNLTNNNIKSCGKISCFLVTVLLNAQWLVRTQITGKLRG